MVYGDIGDILKVERIKFPNGQIDTRNCHFGIIIDNNIDLCTFLLTTHKKPSYEGTYFVLPSIEYKNTLAKKIPYCYVRFREEYESDKNYEIVGRIKRDEIVYKLLKEYNKYLSNHQQIVVNIGSNQEEKKRVIKL